MFGSHLDEATPRQFEDSRNPSALMPGVAVCVIVWFGGLTAFGFRDWGPLPLFVKVALVLLAGLLAGLFVSLALKRAQRRKASKMAEAQRKFQEAETRRKLEEARKIGII